MEYRDLKSHEVRTVGDRTIEGYAAVFYDGTAQTEYQISPGITERFARGAFDNCLRDRDHDVKGRYNHKHLLARRKSGNLHLHTDDVGLRYKLNCPNTAVGDEVLELVRRGDIEGSSVAFKSDHGKERWTQENGNRIREITQVNKLGDVGPVEDPAFSGTTAEAFASNANAALRHFYKAAIEKELTDVKSDDR